MTMIDHSMVVQTPWITVGHTETNSKVHRSHMTILSCKLMLWQNVKIQHEAYIHIIYGRAKQISGARSVTEQHTANCLTILTIEVLFPVLITLLHVCTDHKDFYFGNKILLCFWNLPPKFTGDNFYEHNNTLHFWWSATVWHSLYSCAQIWWKSDVTSIVELH